MKALALRTMLSKIDDDVEIVLHGRDHSFQPAHMAGLRRVVREGRDYYEPDSDEAGNAVVLVIE